MQSSGKLSNLWVAAFFIAFGFDTFIADMFINLIASSMSKNIKKLH